jgi:transcription initiation factor TFIIIB Brf1 subunit/transcription initiation factor TFIIB
VSDIEPNAIEWIDRFADTLGVPAPSRAEVTTLLELAATAARASHRQAAPVACWLAAVAGLTPADALEKAEAVG